MEVEVVFPQVCGAFYKASVVELNLETGKVLLSFQNSWKANTWIELAHVRYPPATPGVPNFEPGTKVEALLPHHDNEPPGWWTGTLLKSKGELHVVEFQSGSEKYQDIVERDNIRLPNTNPPLSKVKFYQQDFPVPEDVQDFCKRLNVHENLRQKVQALCIYYSDENKTVTVLSDNEGCLYKAHLLSEMHFRDLKTQKQLLTRNEVVAQRVSQLQQRQLDSGLYEQRFHVPSDLVGLAIGREGNNVNEARKLDGIVHVEFDDFSSMFRVRAETPDALSKARELLEYTRQTEMIPRLLAGKVIGKRGNVIQEILEKSKVNNIRVIGDEEAKQKNVDISTQVPFEFIGRKSAIENAKLMLDYHLDHLKHVENILQSRRELDSQLQPNSYGADVPTYYPRPGERHPSSLSPPRGRGTRRGGRGGFRGSSGGTRPHSGGSRSEEDSKPPLQDNLNKEEFYVSSEDDSEEEEEEAGRRSGEEQESPPEDDERGPDRRRQPGGSGFGTGRRGRGRGRGGGRGYYRNRGRGPPRDTTWDNTRGPPPPRDDTRGPLPSQERDVSGQNGGPQSQTEGASGGQNLHSSPKPQRTRPRRERQGGGSSQGQSDDAQPPPPDTSGH